MHYLIQSYHLIFPSDESPLILDSKMETVAKLNPPFRGNFKTCKSSAFFNLSRNTCKLRSRVWYVDKSKNFILSISAICKKRSLDFEASN